MVCYEFTLLTILFYGFFLEWQAGRSEILGYGGIAPLDAAFKWFLGLTLTFHVYFNGLSWKALRNGLTGIILAC